MLSLLGAGLLLSFYAIAREWQVHRADHDLQWIENDPLARLRVPGAGQNMPPRAALSESLAQARAAAAETTPDARAEHLDAARALLASAKAGRPGWAQVQVVESYIDSIAFGPQSAQALAAFRASFTGGAFLRDAAPWRIQYGLDQWPRLDPATRRHVVDEAAWYSTLRDGYVDTMTALVGQPAEVPVMRERADLLRTSQSAAQSPE